jgi:hypothetical protein
VSRQRRMHAIGRPRFRRCPALSFIKDALERHEYRTEFMSEFFHYFLALGELGEPQVIDRPARQNERFTEHQLKTRQSTLCPGEDLAIDQLILAKRDAVLGHAATSAVPSIVDADKDAKDVGLNIERIDLPALLRSVTRLPAMPRLWTASLPPGSASCSRPAA